MVDPRALPVLWCGVPHAVSCSGTRDLLKEGSGWGRQDFKVILALTLLNVFSHFLYHVGLEERTQEDIRRKSVITAKRITGLEDCCGSHLSPGINSRKPLAEITYRRESTNLGAGFSWVQKCSVEGSFRGINLFHMVLDSLSSVIFFFIIF